MTNPFKRIFGKPFRFPLTGPPAPKPKPDVPLDPERAALMLIAAAYAGAPRGAGHITIDQLCEINEAFQIIHNHYALACNQNNLPVPERNRIMSEANQTLRKIIATVRQEADDHERTVESMLQLIGPENND